MKQNINEIKRMRELAGLKESQLNENIDISDDEILDAAIQYEDNVMTDQSPITHFMEGAKWYREQLKSK